MDSNPPTYTREKDADGNTKYVSRRLVPPEPTYWTPSPPPPPLTSLLASIDTGADVTSYARVEPVDTIIDNGVSFGVLASDKAAYMDLNYEWVNENIDFGVGVSYLGSDHSYLGFDGGVRLHFPWQVSPFVGVGAYGGDSKTCTTEPIGGGYSLETCEKYFLFAGTFDVGLLVKPVENFQISLFGRTFSRTRLVGHSLADHFDLVLQHAELHEASQHVVRAGNSVAHQKAHDGST